MSIYFLCIFFLLTISPISNMLENLECPVYDCEYITSNKDICVIKGEGKERGKLIPCDPSLYCGSEYKCEENSQTYKKKNYPGFSCTTKSDCFKNCEQNVCKGFAIGEKCDNSTECENTAYCSDQKICTHVKEKGDICEKDEQCAVPYICINNKCSQFFIVKNGESIYSNSSSALFGCQNGTIIDNFCREVNRESKLCDEKLRCTYKEKNNQTYKTESTCNCSYSSNNPQHICAKGILDEGMKEKFEEIKKIIEFLTSEEHYSECHPAEPRLGYCRSYVKKHYDAIKKSIEFNKLLLEYQNMAILEESESCTLRTIFGLDEIPPETPKTCPVYFCEEKTLEYIENKITCAFSTNPFNQNGSGIQVNVTMCPYGFKCDYKSDFVYSNWTFNSTCKEGDTKKTWTIKYPGEECISHDQCIKGNEKSIGFCINGICSGKKGGENCTENKDCVKGYFCNGLYCQRQKGEKNFCINSEECLNYLGCLNNTCIPYYSLPNGTYLNASNPDKKLCRMGTLNDETKQCVELDYYNKSKNDITADGFVKCSIGEMCNYTTGFFNKYKEPVIERYPCECGFRDNGIAYCQLPQTVNTKDWIKYFKYKNKKLDNSCHTSRRESCIEELKSSDNEMFDYYRRKTELAHKFHDSSDCLISVLSGAWMKINYAILICALAILLN